MQNVVFTTSTKVPVYLNGDLMSNVISFDTKAGTLWQIRIDFDEETKQSVYIPTELTGDVQAKFVAD